MITRFVRLIAMTFIGVAAFVGLPLLSWGMHDMGNFFHNPARLLYSVMVPPMQIAAGGGSAPSGWNGSRSG